jgi:hypothetical protein
MNLQNPHRLNNTIMRIKELFSINNTKKNHRAYNIACISNWERAHHAIEKKYMDFTKLFYWRHDEKNVDKEGRILAAVDDNNR